MSLVDILLPVPVKKLKMELSQRQNFLYSVSWNSYIKPLLNRQLKYREEKYFLVLWREVIRATKLLHKSTNRCVKETSNSVTLRKKNLWYKSIKFMVLDYVWIRCRVFNLLKLWGLDYMPYHRSSWNNQGKRELNQGVISDQPPPASVLKQ